TARSTAVDSPDSRRLAGLSIRGCAAGLSIRGCAAGVLMSICVAWAGRAARVEDLFPGVLIDVFVPGVGSVHVFAPGRIERLIAWVIRVDDRPRGERVAIKDSHLT